MSCSRKPCVPAALAAFFYDHPAVALAFSGGTDSAYLLYAARACGCRVRAYYLHSAFQPAFELADARRLAQELGARLTVLFQDALADERVAENPKDRCYHCKRALFDGILRAAAQDGYALILDGTNASDDALDRPGIRALREMGVRSPLRECGLSKGEIRRLSKEAGLFTWDKPAYACLATRIPTGQPITQELLSRIESAEDALFALGFTDFRVRVFHGCARLQLPISQMGRAVEQRERILAALGGLFEGVFLDFDGGRG